MDNISWSDKIKYYTKYLYSRLKGCVPFKKTIINDNLSNCQKNSEILNSLHLNEQAQSIRDESIFSRLLKNISFYFKKILFYMMNYVCINDNMNNENFLIKQSVVVMFEGNINFNTVVLADSYHDIYRIMKHIMDNHHMYERKTFGNLNHIIDKICLVTNDGEEIDVLDTLNTFILYTEPIKLSNIPLLHDIKHEDIKDIKITYFNKMDYKLIEIDFQLNKDQNIDFLNTLIT
jgi:hypothetical protein